MEKEENLVKKTCRELGINQRELSEKTGVTEKAISNWANNKNNIPNSFVKTLELLKSEKELLMIKQAFKLVTT